MIEKECNVCFEKKPGSEFYVNLGMAGGLQNRCKDCTKKKTKERLAAIMADPELAEKEKQRHRLKYHRLSYKDKHKPTPEKKKEVIERYKNKYPEKIKAKYAAGNIEPLVKGNQLHHWSYNPEHYKDLIELTMRGHAKAHIYMTYDQERMMYRRTDNNELLDTKEKHTAYIMDCIANKPD